MLQTLSAVRFASWKTCTMARFPETQWSLIRRSGSSSTGRAAFDELARAYRMAILAFFRAHMDQSASEDATQAFLALSYEHDWWSRADADLGSFRGFLLLLLRRHLNRTRAEAGREPRHLQIDNPAAASGDVDRSPSAEDQFDARFVLLLTARAIDSQREQYRARGKATLFERLLPLLGSPPEHGQLKLLAAAMDVPANTLTIELRRLRERLRETLREHVMELCVNETAFELEWAAVQRILGRAG